MNKWDYRFFSLAREVSTWSKDLKHKVGSVIADPANRIIATGYNGLPRNIDSHIGDNRLLQTIHAEENAILYAQQSLVGCSIYIWPFAPCAHCSSLIIQAGITKVGLGPEQADQRWRTDIGHGLFETAGIEVVFLTLPGVKHD